MTCLTMRTPGPTRHEPLTNRLLEAMEPQLRASLHGLLGTVYELSPDVSLRRPAKASAERLLTAIERLLLSLEPSTEPSPACDFQPQELFREVTRRLRATHEGIALEVELSCPDLWIRGDVERAEQLGMLLGSMAAARTPRAEITLSGEYREGRLTFEVSSSETPADGDDTQIVLSRALARSLGGSLEIDETDSSSMRVVLPFEAGTPPPQLHTVGARILIIEDETLFGRVAEHVSRNLGCKPIVTAQGRRAVEAAEREIFDLVLLGTSRVEDVDLAVSIRGLQDDLPVVVVSPRADPAFRAACRSAGADHVLALPLRDGALERTVRRWPRRSAFFRL